MPGLDDHRKRDGFKRHTTSKPTGDRGAGASGRPTGNLGALRTTDSLTDDPDLRRYVRTVAVAGAFGILIYLWILDGFFDGRPFSNFYDLQGRAFLDGRMDVPAGSLGIEAFVSDGRNYLYFPPWPALLRLPVLLFTEGFDGRLTAVSMLLAWLTTFGVSAALLWRVRRMLRDPVPLACSEAMALGLVLTAGTAGSVVVFLAAIPWVYHEAYSWAIAMALGFAFCLLGVVERPTAWRILATGAFTAGAVLSRTTAGWACAAAILIAAVVLPGRTASHGRHLWWQLWLAAAVPVGLGMAVNWAKFRHPFLFPIDQQVFTALSAQRRAAIAANGGDLFSPDMLWSTLVNYFRPDGIRFVSVFPYVTLPPHIARSYGGGFIDQANRTGSVVSFAPLLFLLTAGAVIATLRPRAPERLAQLRAPLLGLGGIPLGILFYAYIAHRYASEFAPLLLLGGAIGVVELHRRLDGRPRRTRTVVTAAMAVLTAFSVAATVAAALNTRALAEPGEPALRSYIDTQLTLSRWTGNPLDGYVRVSNELPAWGPADRIHIVGECTAYYLGSGDEFRPWVEIGTRPLEVSVTPAAGDAFRGRAVLASFRGRRTSEVLIEQEGARRYRLRVRGGGLDDATQWFVADQTFTVSIEPAGPYDFFVAVEGLTDVAPGLFADRETFDAEWLSRPNVLDPVDDEVLARADIGAELAQLPSAPLDQCEELLRRERG